MDAATRRLVAYTVASLISGKSSSSVYDYDTGSHTPIDGTVSDQAVNVFDYNAGCHFGGSGSGGNFSLFHYGRSSHVSLEVRPDGEFSGFDYGDADHFGGSVTGQSVSFYDYGEGAHFSYSI